MAIDRDPTANNFPNDYTTSGIDNRILLRSKAIREKMYGVDVREALAQGVEIGGSVAQNAKDTSDQAQKNVQSAITTLNAKMQTADATIKSMNDLDAQLADTAKKAGGIVTQAKAVLDDIQNNPNKYRGVKGDAGTIKIGKVTAGPAPTVTNVGTASDATLDFTLVKGDKGDTGTVDNTGLTNAPAFQALQKQVNNSAVGTNLFVTSTAVAGYISWATGTVNSSTNDITTDYISMSSGNFTFTAYDTPFTNPSSHSHYSLYDSSKTYLGYYATLKNGVNTIADPKCSYIRISMSFVDEGGTAGKYQDWLDSNRYKLELGSHATDWCLNPSEILTQSDYSKIKAAIVALGGALS